MLVLWIQLCDGIMYLSISILMLFLRTNRIQPSSRSFMHSWRTSKLLLMIVINRYILIHSRYKRNLKRMYIVHANFWFRVSSYVISLFPSPSALLSLAPFSCPPLSLPTYLLYLPTYIPPSLPPFGLVPVCRMPFGRLPVRQ